MVSSIRSTAGDPAEFKRNVYARLAAAGAGLADPSRIAMLDFICQGPKSVAADCSASMALASHHLRLLKAAGLARDRRAGRRVFYEATAFGLTLWSCLARSGQEHNEEIRALLRTFFEASDKGSPEPVSLKELLRRVDCDEVMLIDVRPADEYEAGHFRGAVSVPLSELERRLKEIPAGREVVAYCRGPYCVLSHRAVLMLKKRGVCAVRLSESVIDAREAGIRIESGPAKAKKTSDKQVKPGKTTRRRNSS